MRLTIYRNTNGMRLTRGNRLIIKGFKSQNAMASFMCGRQNYYNQWNYCDEQKAIAHGFSDLKPGTYAYAGQDWHNVKNLDPSVLAHI